jgi:hypothetical protein
VLTFPLLVAGIAAACGPSSPGPASSPGSPTPTPAGLPSATAQPASPSPGPVPSGSYVDGVVVRVVSTGLSKVSSFDLRAGDGSIYTFQLGLLENGAVFPPGHLTEHQATAAPVRVYFSLVDQVLYAIRLEDASAPTAT